MFARLMLLLTAAAAGLAATPSHAMSGDCVWGQLAPATRDAMIQGYLRNGPDVLGRVFVSARELEDIDANCASTAVPDDLKDRLFSAVVLERGAAVFLKQRLGWRDEDLQDAWERMAPHERAALRRGADAILQGERPADDLSDAMRAFLGDSPALDDPKAIDEVMGYLTSRAIREAIEQRG